MKALHADSLVMDRRAILRLSAAALVAGAALRPGYRASAATDPTSPIQQLNAALLAAMKAGQRAGFGQRYAILAPAVQQAIDLDTILRASVGLRWATLNGQERAGLSATFVRYTVSTYAANFDDYSGQNFRILPETRSLSNGDVIVHTQIVRADGSTTPIDYVMRQAPTGWKAVDVLADGAISRVAVQRSDFRALLDRGGVPALEAGLMQKVASLSGGLAA